MEKDEKERLYQQQINLIINELSEKEKVEILKLKESHLKNGTLSSGAYPIEFISVIINLLNEKIDKSINIYKEIYFDNVIDSQEKRNKLKVFIEEKKVHALSKFKFILKNDNSLQQHPKNLILNQFERKLSQLISHFNSKINIELIKKNSLKNVLPEIKYFEIKPNKINEGETAILKWKIENNTSPIIIENTHQNGDKGKYALGILNEGKYTVNPQKEDEIIYSLIAENEVGKSIKSVKLLVQKKENVLKAKTNSKNKKKKRKKLLTKFFISHSEKDKKIVESFIKEILIGNFAIDDEIYCTSVSGMRNNPGDDWQKKIEKKLKESKIFLAFVSEKYKKSEICQNELGAAWILKKQIIPLVIKPMNFKNMGFLLNRKHAEKIDDGKGLDRLKDQFQKQLNIKNVKSDKWTERKEDFIKKIRKILKKRVQKK